VWAGALSWWRSNAAHVQVFCSDLLANSITNPNGVCGLMDCSATVFVDEYSNFFNIFCRYWCLVAWNICHLQLTPDRPWNVNAIQQPLSNLNSVLQKSHRAFQGFRELISEPRAKLYAYTLLDFAIHCRQNETWSRKSTRIKTTCVRRAVSRGRLMQYTGRRPWPPLSSSFTEAVTAITFRELTDTTSYYLLDF
jgi:hypothetical protein